MDKKDNFVIIKDKNIILPRGFTLDKADVPKKVYSSILGKYINPKTGEVIFEGKE